MRAFTRPSRPQVGLPAEGGSCPRKERNEEEAGTQRQVGPSQTAPPPPYRHPGGTGEGAASASNAARSLIAEGASFGRICVSAPNWKPKTIWTADCLYVLRGMNSESVDLIYLDPPFNSKADYAAPIGSKAAGAAFKDTWSLSDLDVEWINLMEARHPALYRVLLAAMTPSDKSYLAYMAARLLEMRRVLKPTGSVYLHCDPTMSHYLKIVMDSIFGRANFRNEVVWYYRGAGTPKKDFARRHDTLLRYAGNDRHFDPDPARQPYAEATVERFSQYIGNVREGRDYGQQSLNPKGKHPDDVFTDIQPIAPSAKARTGYPTEKPLPLLQRIIATSCPEDGHVLDPFCGCATTMVAADDLGREWVGVDISPKAAEVGAKSV